MVAHRLDLQLLSTHDLVSPYPADAHSLDYPLRLAIINTDPVFDPRRPSTLLYSPLLPRDAGRSTVTTTTTTTELKLLPGANVNIDIGVFTASNRKLGTATLALDTDTNTYYDVSSPTWKQVVLNVRPPRSRRFNRNNNRNTAKLKISYRVRKTNGSRVRRTTTTTTTTRRVSRVRRPSRTCVHVCNNNINSNNRPRISNACNHTYYYEPGCRCDASESCVVCENLNHNSIRNRARRARGVYHDRLLTDCLNDNNAYGIGRRNTREHDALLADCLQERRVVVAGCDNDEYNPCQCCAPVSPRVMNGSVYREVRFA